MKRTNLVLDEQLLDRATQVLGVKTYSATVNLALEEVLRMRKIQNISHFFGQRLWEGDLSEMREDDPSGDYRAKAAVHGRAK
ncbi:MAG: type II toxin-antitoxin system VapB family antitoxin [Bryobacteraceae bacterium]